MNLSLDGKYAVVCGSSQGIGAAIANELALLGANCTLLARNEERLKAVVGNLATSRGQQHSYYAIDFSDMDAVRNTVQSITAEAPVHILVNNTGGPAAGPIVAATEDQFLQAFQQHLLSSHTITKAVMEGMKSEGYGRIINVISTSVKIPLNNLGVSNTIRGAMASWAKTMANELGQFGITVNNVLPGFTKTPRLESLISTTAERSGKSTDVVEKSMQEEVPAKRFGDPSEIAAMAAFLASPAAAYVNGTSIPVDGGRTGSI
ncbi:MAG: SDR family oxidoreductase [Chitinophagaceae bacterium]|nr:MAG: SDR family oxidoreductase [Chitinophagaceae bacterium]